MHFGLLYYVASNTLLRLTANPEELQALLMTRNRLAASYRGRNTILPRPISNSHSCKQCSQLENCASMSKLLSEGQDSLNTVIFEKISQINTTTGIEFYKKWLQLVDLEEAESLRIRTESKSTAIGVLVGCATVGGLSAFGRYLATFEIQCTSPSDLIVGEPVCIYSDDNLSREMAIGFISSITANCLELTCDRNVNLQRVPGEDFDPTFNQQFTHHQLIGRNFLICKDELTTGYTLSRSNLTSLFHERQSKLKTMIMDLRAPTFQATNIALDEDLDEGQVKSMRHCLSANDYALILGMPGTGKTTTLVSLISTMVKAGYRILVTSYTHSAVDNLLAKLMAANVHVLRIGNSDRVDERLKSRVLCPRISHRSHPSRKSSHRHW